jgi:hypothetical protein
VPFSFSVGIRLKENKMNTPISYLHLKTSQAAKTGQRAEGRITYALLKDSNSQQLYFCLLANDGGGYFSQEAVSFSAIQQCLSGIKANHPVPAKTFRTAFVGRSSNNAGFLVAALRNEGLLVPAPSATHQHYIGESWENWKVARLAEPGEPFELPGQKTKSEGVPLPKVEAMSELGKGKKARKAALPKVSKNVPAPDEARESLDAIEEEECHADLA